MKQLDYVLNNEKEALAFLKTQYPMYHLSNVFFRDVQYGIQTMFERRGEKVGYPDAEKVARAFVEKLEKQKVFIRIDNQSWVLDYPEYKTVATKPAAPAKPAPGAAPAKSPAAAGAPRAPLPPLGSAKPAGAKPALPPLASAKPAATSAQSKASALQVEEVAQQVEQPKFEPKQVEISKPVQPVSTSSVAPPAGQRKPLPPLRGNYTPAGKK